MNALQVETRGPLAIVTMTHGKANAIDLQFCNEVADTFEALASKIGGVVLTARGSIFSAGVDLVRLADEGESYTRRFLPAFDRLVLSLFTFPRPLVAAVNGHAIAGGCLVACTADYRVMAQGPFKMGVPELQVGVPFPPAALEVLRFAAPERYVQELASGEKIYDPDEAQSHGLVHAVVDEANLLETALKEAGRLASLHPSAFSLTKAMLRRPVVDRIAQLNEAYGNQIVTEWLAEATRTAIRDYVSRTFKRN